jgi:crossover junction endodeoxyribonuclease RuvC
LRVLGIDPGSRYTGFGVVEQHGNRLVHLGHGVLRLDGDAPLQTRLHELFDGLTRALAIHRPDAVAVEGVFTFKNARSALVLGHARGVALLVAAQRELPVHEYSPAKVKKSVGAGGASAKDAVARMVQTLLGIEVTERADASDALAVAICHLNNVKVPFADPKRSARASFEERLRPSFERPVLRAVVGKGSGR